MRAEFHRPDAPDEVVGTVEWFQGEIRVSAPDEAIGGSLRRIFRPTPVLIEDPAYRMAGTAGPVLQQPGTLRWFTAAARARSQVEGLAVRFVAEPAEGLGWDPAGSYRPFQAVVERLGAPSQSQDLRP